MKGLSLVTCALINICQEHNVELTILCDKSSERAHEVCTLSDNVVCIRREPEDVDSFSMFVERMAEPPFPSAIIQYSIKNVSDLFVCDNKGLHINDSADITHKFIGSMKEYWRKTEKVVTKNSKAD